MSSDPKATAPKPASPEKATADEIDQILAEINTLQKGLSEVPQPAAAPPTAQASEPKPVGPVPVPPLAEEAATVAAALAQETASALSEKLAAPEDPVSTEDPALMEETLAHVALMEAPGKNQTMAKEESKQDGSLTLSLAGNMTLKLKYECEGQEVTIGFTDHYLTVELADGTEFRIPVGRAALRKVA